MRYVNGGDISPSLFYYSIFRSIYIEWHTRRGGYVIRDKNVQSCRAVIVEDAISCPAFDWKIK